MSMFMMQASILPDIRTKLHHIRTLPHQIRTQFSLDCNRVHAGCHRALHIGYLQNRFV